MSRKNQSGFSLIELLIVCAIALIAIGMATPLILNAMKTYRLRQAGTNYANLLQTGRMRAVQDDQYYPVLIDAAASNACASVSSNSACACVDLNRNGTCDGSSANSSAEPVVLFDPTIQPQSYSSAPSTTNLQNQYLPSTCGTNAACVGVDPNTVPIGPAFGPRSLPCYVSGSTCAYITSNGINGSSNVPVAFEIYLKNTQTNAWEAVTVSPAGRIREWYYNSNSTWIPLN
jgi:prepilin-type N-terminal cleavage/methylation domain-containing protein